MLDLLEEISGKKIGPRISPGCPRIVSSPRCAPRIRKSYATLLHGTGKVSSKEIKRRDEDLERAAITLTEGGGGALYLVCSKLKNTGIEAKIAQAFHEILLDEVNIKIAAPALSMGKSKMPPTTDAPPRLFVSCAASGCACAMSNSASR